VEDIIYNHVVVLYAMKLTLLQFISLDGVTQGPGAPDEDTSDSFERGGWLVPFIDDHFIRAVTDWTAQADAFLFGRRTYEAFSLAWPKNTDPADTVATALNGLPKYVASTTLTTTAWGPATILGADVAAQVAALKDQPGREIQIHGSTTLGRSMLAAGLVDTVRLAVAPVLIGAGRRLFADGPATAVKPVHSETTPAGLSLQTYDVTGAPTYGSYGG
jgi:dihydrofolate reductase